MIIMYVMTVPSIFLFLYGQLDFMHRNGFIVHGVSSGGEHFDKTKKLEYIQLHKIEMSREITPIDDLFAFFKLLFLFLNIRPTIVNISSPKAGFLGILAARLARIPVIIFTLRGLVSSTKKGMKQRILRWTEKVTCRFADRVIAISPSIRQRAIDLGFSAPEKIIVIGAGSSHGVDADQRYNPLRPSLGSKEEIREQLGLPPDALIIGYIGRLVREKGIVELEEAWRLLRDSFPSLVLLLVGPPEPFDPIPPEVWDRLVKDERVYIKGWVDDPAPIYKALDIMTLPSYREGFGNTPLEAAAMGIPSVATKIDGLMDSVSDGVTGILVPSQDSRALAEALRTLIVNPELRVKMGRLGRERALRDFKPQTIWQGVYEQYIDLLRVKGLDEPKMP